MATKKPDTTSNHDDFKAMPSTMPDAGDQPPTPVEPVVPTPDPAPTYTDEVLVSLYQKLTPDEARRVTKIKSDSGTFIGYLKSLRDSVHDAESQRMYSVAITHAETASMWAVKAITNRG